MQTSTQLSACFYLMDGVEVLDFAGPMEVFALAGIRVFTVALTKEPVLSQGILKVLPDYDLTDVPPANILAVFGGNPASFRNDALIDWIRRYESHTDHVFSVCSGAFALGHAGLLDGRQATTFHSRIEELRAAFPNVTVLSDVRFIDNGRIITTAGISAGIDGALHLVSKLKGEAAAKAVAEEMEYDRWIPKDGFVTNPKQPVL
ncbi:MAG: DJ-1/PfpI family protein [Cyclobacteriaceae bacterium]|nr:DJ-1/PfpI family protein [Cyclobacteriaceae bacterium]